jgi:hypothetical protein
MRQRVVSAYFWHLSIQANKILEINDQAEHISRLESEVDQYKVENARLESILADYAQELHNIRGIIAIRDNELVAAGLVIEGLQAERDLALSAVQGSEQ